MPSLLSFHVIYFIVFVWLSEETSSACDETFTLRVENVNKRIGVVFEWDTNNSGFEIYLYHSQQNISCIPTIEDLQKNRILPYSVNSSSYLVNQSDDCDTVTCVKFYDDAPEGFYCAKKNSHQCSLYTLTMYFGAEKKFTSLTSSGSQMNDSITTTGIVVLVLAVAIIAAIIFMILRIKMSRQRKEKPQMESKSHLPLLQEPNNCKIFVVYHRDNDHHFEMVKLFVQLLQTLFDWKVIVDYENNEVIATMGITAWVTNSIISCSKIIFISSPMSRDIVECIIQNKKREDNCGHITEKLFAFAWRITSSNHLCYDYNKVYNVRFRSTMKFYVTPVIVPHRHFEIPTHLPELVQCIMINNPTMKNTLYDGKNLESFIKSSPLYLKLLTAVLPILQPNEILEEHNSEDETWISPGL
ncbi:hypothetical protein CHUAL_013374 [Chamberlinius hualienensis]